MPAANARSGAGLAFRNHVRGRPWPGHRRQPPDRVRGQSPAEPHTPWRPMQLAAAASAPRHSRSRPGSGAGTTSRRIRRISRTPFGHVGEVLARGRPCERERVAALLCAPLCTASGDPADAGCHVVESRSRTARCPCRLELRCSHRGAAAPTAYRGRQASCVPAASRPSTRVRGLVHAC